MTMQESVRDLSGLDARVHANSKSPRLGNRIEEDDVLGPARAESPLFASPWPHLHLHMLAHGPPCLPR